MSNCERCGKEFEHARKIPKFVVCEAYQCGLACSGYLTEELVLCPECLGELEKFMEGRDGGDD